MDATKVALLLSGTDPTDVPTIFPLLDGMERHFITLMQAHDLLCLTSSTSLLRVVTATFAEVVNSTVHLVDEIIRGTTSVKCAPVLGVVWSACNNMKAITLDNKKAVSNDVDLVTCTMKDAARELQEAIEASSGGKTDEDDIGSIDGLTPAARALAIPVLQLMKAGCNICTSLEKLFAPLTQSPADIDCMECALECVRALGSQIDDVACALYECSDDEDLQGVVTLATAFHGSCTKLVALLLSNPSLRGQAEAQKRLEVVNGVLTMALDACRVVKP
eukprot:Mycagemm_TRINITY_DN10287_c1_g1::TRINITY_DN10287_c1_g1_i1::g.3691::m.3691 type:complete len:276 gc:universal TRINITY_DN10287_c1_g1_i1:260-1087(+)